MERVVIAAHEHLSAGLQPVLRERPFHRAGGLAFDANHRVAPLRGLFYAITPLIGEARATTERERALHHHDLTMGAVVDARAGPPAERMVPGDLASGLAQRDNVAVCERSAAYSVDHHVDADAGAGALFESP